VAAHCCGVPVAAGASHSSGSNVAMCSSWSIVVDGLSITLSLDPWMGDFEWSSARFGAVSRAVEVAAHV